jgi:hypothetical protein
MALNHPHHNKSIIPYIVLIGVPNKRALDRVIQKLNDNHIAHTPFFEPDWDMGLSAIATTPNLSQEQHNALKNYSIWREPKNFSNTEDNAV